MKIKKKYEEAFAKGLEVYCRKFGTTGKIIGITRIDAMNYPIEVQFNVGDRTFKRTYTGKGHHDFADGYKKPDLTVVKKNKDMLEVGDIVFADGRLRKISKPKDGECYLTHRLDKQDCNGWYILDEDVVEHWKKIK